MEGAGFVHLHNHSDYSLLDGCVRVDQLVAMAAEQNMTAVALTDHGNLFGAIEFSAAAQKQGIKPIIGCEFYVSPRSRFEKKNINGRGIGGAYQHLILLARNNTGYQNLMALASAGYLEGFYYRPRIDKDLLQLHHEGLICTTACVGGEIPQLILNGQYDEAKKSALFYQELFGREFFYIEIQDHGISDEAKANKELIRIAREIGAQVIAANDTHYAIREDARVHEVALCLQTQKCLSDTDRMTFPGGPDYYFKNEQEMRRLFIEIPEAVDNTLQVAEKCEFDLESYYAGNVMPECDIPEKETAESHLRNLCLTGLEELYPETDMPRVAERLDHELEIINSMGFPGYFLICQDFIRFCRQQGIPTGPGRGSGAGSIVAYALGITRIDPLRFNLLFERFLNPERVSMPDIDSDFCERRRPEVIEYIRDKYGSDRVCQIITFGKMKARMVIRDVGRVLSIPLSEVDKLAKMIPATAKNLKEAREQSGELDRLIKSKPEYEELWRYSLRLEGMHRNAGKHAAGVVISKDELTRYTPLYLDSKADNTNLAVTTQYDMGALETTGLLKMDILGLKTLTLIDDCIRMIRAGKSPDFDISTINLQDQETLDLFSAGLTKGIFQFEADFVTKVCRKLRPTCIEDLIALNALNRPGPMQYIDTFIARAHGEEKVVYRHEWLEPILEETHGIAVYQEQVMQIVQTMAGFSLGEADVMRRIMGKKKKDKMPAQEQKFIEGAVAKGVDKKLAYTIFQDLLPFCEYGFNKSHAAAYTYLSFQTAYLKTHYPLEFMSALLTSEAGNQDKITLYLKECANMGIKVSGPDINRGYRAFSVNDNSIVYGFSAINRVGDIAIDLIISAREKQGPFSSLHHFCEHVDLGKVNKGVIEALIDAGAFDSLIPKRAQAVAVLERALEHGHTRQRELDGGQLSFFDLFEEDREDMFNELDEVREIAEWPKDVLLQREKDVLGFYMSGHPLDDYQNIIENPKNNITAIASLPQHEHDTDATIAGIVTDLRKHITRRNNQMMAFLQLEDHSGVVSVTVFAKLYQEAAELLTENAPLLVYGKVERERDPENPQLKAEKITPIDKARYRKVPTMEISVKLDKVQEKVLNNLKDLFLEHPGDSRVYLKFSHQDTEVRMQVNPQFSVQSSKNLEKGIFHLMNNAKIEYGESYQ